MKSCHGPVRAAVGDAFTNEEIGDILDQLAARHKAKKAADPTADDTAAWHAAAEDLSRDKLRTALIEKRARIYAAKAKTRRADALTAMGGEKADALMAFMVGDQRQGFGRALSLDAVGRALETDMLAQIERGLRDKGLWDRVTSGDRAFEDAVAVEMARRSGGAETPTGDADAEAVAEVLGSVVERGKALQNAEGAWINTLPGYIVRQQHDALRVAGGFWSGVGSLKALKKGGVAAVRSAAYEAAYTRWRAVIEPLLDERTFVNVDDRGEFLSGIWWNIVTGKHQVVTGLTDLGEFKPPAGKAKAVSESRVLHFKSARDWMAYHRQFGRGSLFSAVVGDVRRAAQNTAIMRGFGPNPEAAFNAELERGLKAARKAGDAKAGADLMAPKVQRAFELLNGGADAPENVRLAMVGRMLRGQQSLAKLGGMVLSAFADLPVSVQALARTGVPWLEGYQGVFTGVSRLGGETSRQVADLLDVGARTASARLTTRFAAEDGPIGWVSAGQRLNMLIQGFEWWNDGLRSGVAVMIAKDFGRQADSAYDGLAAGTRETLERFGIDAAGWDRLRAKAQKLEDGRYITLDAADGDEELGLRFRALVHETLDNATSEARAREQGQIAFGTRPGTVVGEAVRLYTQFWSFPQTFIGRSLLPAAQGYAGQKPAALIAHLILSTTLFGYASMQAKQLVKGREPRPLSGEAVLAAMLQGGGLGIYGDFLFGEYNRFGASPIATLGGPAVGEFEAALKLWGKLRTGEDPAAEAFQFAKGNTPFINTWYTRAALDYVLFWRMQEAISPGWADRYQRRIEDQTGSEFWLRPTEAVD